MKFKIIKRTVCNIIVTSISAALLTTPVFAEVEPLLNEGFENGVGEWKFVTTYTSDGMTLTTDSQAAYNNSEYGLKIANMKDRFAVESPKITFEAGEFYEVSGYVKGNNTKNRYAYFGTGNGVYTYSNNYTDVLEGSLFHTNGYTNTSKGTAVSNDSWTNVKYVLTPKTGNISSSIAFISRRTTASTESGADIYLDNVVVKKMEQKIEKSIPEYVQIPLNGSDEVTLNFDFYLDNQEVTNDKNVKYELVSGGDGISLSGNKLTVESTTNISSVDVKVTYLTHFTKEYKISLYSGVPTAPIAKNVRIDGIAKVGKTLTLLYEYEDINREEELGTTFKWFRDGVEIEGATEKSYLLTEADEGAVITAEVTPKNNAQSEHTGVPVMSAETIMIRPDGILRIYVSPDGDDNNNGDIDNPLKTIYKARLEARKLNDVNEVEVIFREGSYYMEYGIDMTAKDSGASADMPVTYKAYNGENVIFTGSKPLDSSCYYKVTDPQILNRVISEEARNSLYVIDAKAMGIELFKEKMHIVDNGGWRGYDYGRINPIISVNGKQGEPARWPDNDFSPVGTVYSSGKAVTDANGNIDIENSQGMQITIPQDRYKFWKNAKDAYIYSQWSVGFWDCSVMIDNISDTGVITTDLPDNNQHVSLQASLLFYNMLEEISMDGEYYVDRENEKIYFMAKSADNIALTLLNDEFINIRNADNIRFCDITFTGNRGTAIVVNDSSNVVFDGCTIKDICGIAFSCAGKSDEQTSGIINSAITYVEDGIALSNGFAVNCIVENFGKKCYDRGASLGGNTLFKNNTMRNSDYMAMQFGGNNNIIEYNEIYNVCKHSGDMGAIYSAASNDENGNIVKSEGNIIRNNYMHDIWSRKQYGNSVKMIYFDLSANSILVENNVFENTYEVGIRNAGGAYNTYKSNVFISCGYALGSLQDLSAEKKETITVSGNMFIDSRNTSTTGSNPEGYGENYVCNTLDIFTDFENGDLSLTDEAKLLAGAGADDYVSIDLNSCGVKEERVVIK